MAALSVGPSDAACVARARLESGVRGVGCVSLAVGAAALGSGRMSLERANGLPGAAFMRMTAAARQIVATSVARIARRATVEAGRVLTIRGGASATMSRGVLKGASSGNGLVACGVSHELVKGGATS